jgi:hypothetical protein
VQEQTKFVPSFPAHLIIEIAVKVILWMMAVMNTELLIRWNYFDLVSSSGSPWQFGQVSLLTKFRMYYQHLIMSIDPANVSCRPPPGEHDQCIQTVTDINK